MNTYTAGSKSVVRSEAEFQRLSQTIATSIQKIHQNGMNKKLLRDGAWNLY